MANPPTRRCFFGLPLDVACRDDLVEAMMAVDVPGLRRIPSENLHVTIKFLGDVADPFLAQVIAATDELMRGRAGFDLEVIGSLWLPNDRRPRALAAECRAEPALIDLAEAADVTMNDLGFPLEGRAFVPHITLGRMKMPPRRPVPEIDLPATGFRADSLVLYESRLLPVGPEYTALAHWPLA